MNIKERGIKIGVASLILGIISFLVSFSIFKDFSLICGVIAIVLGIISIVKKKGKGMAIAGVILSVLGCIILFSGSSSDNTGTVTSNSGSNKGNDTQSVATQTLRVGDTWTVDGQWSVTVNSVEETQERNQYSDKTPAAVYIVTYTYENIGYKDEYGDGLFISL